MCFTVPAIIIRPARGSRVSRYLLRRPVFATEAALQIVPRLCSAEGAFAVDRAGIHRDVDSTPSAELAGHNSNCRSATLARHISSFHGLFAIQKIRQTITAAPASLKNRKELSCNRLQESRQHRYLSREIASLDLRLDSCKRNRCL